MGQEKLNRELKELVKTFRVNEFQWEAYSNICEHELGLDPSKVNRFFMKKIINREIVLTEEEVREYLGLKTRK